MSNTVRFTPPVTKDGVKIPSYLGLLVKKFEEVSSKRKTATIEDISLTDKQEIYTLFIDHYVKAKVLLPAKSGRGYSISSKAVDYLSVKESKMFVSSYRLEGRDTFPALVDETFEAGTLGRQKQLTAINDVFPIISDYAERLGLVDSHWGMSTVQRVLFTIFAVLAGVTVIVTGLVCFGVLHPAWLTSAFLAVPLIVFTVFYFVEGGSNYENYLTEDGRNVKDQFVQYETVLKSEIAGASYVDEYSASDKRRKIRV